MKPSLETLLYNDKMKSLEKIKMIRDYCDYLEKHIKNIEKCWNIIKIALKNENVIYDDHLFWFIYDKITEHDLSKFSQEEFIPYAEWFFGKYGRKWDIWDGGITGKNDHEKLYQNFQIAWEHHKNENQHHWENWTNAKENFPNEQSCHMVCMVVDWMAMGLEFGDTAEEYYLKNKHKINIPETLQPFLTKIFISLKNI